jgi:hypothetical protein
MVKIHMQSRETPGPGGGGEDMDKMREEGD